MDRATFACSTAFFRDYSASSHAASCLPTGHVDFIEKVESFTYSDFFRDYLIPNRPCIFSAKFTEGWGSRRNWVTWDGKPNFDYLLQKFGEAIVPVANCDVKEYNSNPKEQIHFKEYINYWKEYIKNDYRSPRGCLYLKDWHLSRAFPEQDVYTTPVYFTSDWLNEYWDAIAVDDYRFVYMGPKGSWTPFHADVFRSYSWSANICGRKKWLLYPPGQEEYLKDRHGNLPFDVTAPGLQDSNVYPRYTQSQPPVEILQEAGEIVFIPSGWHHQVYNLEDTVSINHNWVNGCNVAIMWCFLQDELAAVQREISEWKDPMDDWHLQCQLIMKSCTGIDYKEFYNFLKVIAENRISVLENGLDDEALAKNTPKAAISTLGMLHAVFDLKRTVKVLTSLSANEDFKKLDLTSLSPPPEALLHHLKAAIDTALL
ncbi:JmjC domain-containing protein 4 [Struthio camelus australis]|uniref:2-oxoglutarate and iron-dependent oxygenase JMJD4 n=1 Tax=Struthio camelus australis TaxID=441894 RepID=A0A093HWS4_STRCA|nr:PREDICTED: jmjC domain-containing protein 4 [Struthio camelus australis]KFV86101.1 JmjC domain-containing protein 4 [Struthio camelus australis]